MKKIIFTLVMTMLIAGNAMAAATSTPAVVVPPIYSSGFSPSSAIMQGMVTDKNYNITITNRDVEVNFLTSQFMTGSLIVDGEKIHFEDYGTYHTMRITLSDGEHTIQPIAKIGARIVYGKIATIVIE